MDTRVHNEGRRRKRESEKIYIQYNSITPPKYVVKKSVRNTVKRWEEKFGYNYDCPEDQVDPYMRELRQEFQDKAAKYCGGYNFVKKQTRFDKMKMKEEMGFKLEEMPIKKKLKRADHIIGTLMKRQALFALMHK